MKPHVKTGLIVGAIGLVANVFVAAILGICGPVVAMAAGLIAGLMVAGKTVGQPDQRKLAITSAAIAGGLVWAGQVIGGLSWLAIAKSLQLKTLFGNMPTASSPAAEQVGFWVGGILSVMCLGGVGLGMAIGAGALAAYFKRSAQPQGYAPQGYAPQTYPPPQVPSQAGRYTAAQPPATEPPPPPVQPPSPEPPRPPAPPAEPPQPPSAPAPPTDQQQ